jgi:ketosteroid isomerase-like protein
MTAASLDLNKKVVRDYFTCGNAGDSQGCLNLLTDDFELDCKAKPPIGYKMNKAGLATMLASIDDTLVRPLRITLHQLTAEDDRVAVKGSSKGQLAKGGLYENDYHFLITLRDGKIAHIEEYLCSYTMWRLLDNSIWEDAVKAG